MFGVLSRRFCPRTVPECIRVCDLCQNAKLHSLECCGIASVHAICIRMPYYILWSAVELHLCMRFASER